MYLNIMILMKIAGFKHTLQSDPFEVCIAKQASELLV